MDLARGIEETLLYFTHYSRELIVYDDSSWVSQPCRRAVRSLHYVKLYEASVQKTALVAARIPKHRETFANAQLTDPAKTLHHNQCPNTFPLLLTPTSS